MWRKYIDSVKDERFKQLKNKIQFSLCTSQKTILKCLFFSGLATATLIFTWPYIGGSVLFFWGAVVGIGTSLVMASKWIKKTLLRIDWGNEVEKAVVSNAYIGKLAANMQELDSVNNKVAARQNKVACSAKTIAVNWRGLQQANDQINKINNHTFSVRQFIGKSCHDVRDACERQEKTNAKIKALIDQSEVSCRDLNNTLDRIEKLREKMKLQNIKLVPKPTIPIKGVGSYISTRFFWRIARGACSLVRVVRQGLIH